MTHPALVSEADFVAAQRVRAELGQRRLTLVVDGVGGAAGRGALELLAPGGRFVICGWSSGTATEITTADLYGRGITASSAIGPGVSRPLRELEEQALREAAQGWFNPLVTEFPLAEAARAHRELEGRGTVGKVLLVP